MRPLLVLVLLLAALPACAQSAKVPQSPPAGGKQLSEKARYCFNYAFGFEGASGPIDLRAGSVMYYAAVPSVWYTNQRTAGKSTITDVVYIQPDPRRNAMSMNSLTLIGGTPLGIETAVSYFANDTMVTQTGPMNKATADDCRKTNPASECVLKTTQAQAKGVVKTWADAFAKCPKL